MWGWEAVRMWGCGDVGDVRMWGCEDVGMWGCGDERMRGCGDVGHPSESGQRREDCGRTAATRDLLIIGLLLHHSRKYIYISEANQRLTTDTDSLTLQPHKSHKRGYLTTFRSRYRASYLLAAGFTQDSSYSPWKWFPCIEIEASWISNLPRRNCKTFATLKNIEVSIGLCNTLLLEHAPVTYPLNII